MAAILWHSAPMMLLKYLSMALIAYLLLLVIIFIYQDRLIYYPTQQDFFNCPQLSALGFHPVVHPYQQLQVKFYLRKSPHAKAYLIHFHGNAGSACDRRFFLQSLGSLPLNILLVEYPGYSSDTQKMNEENLLRTGLGTYQFVEKSNGENLPILLFGESLGHSVALYVATQRLVTATILQSPFSSLADVARHHYPFLPVSYLLKTRLPSARWAAQLQGPVLILHGALDDIVPLKLGQRLAQEFKVPPQFVVFPQAGHNDLSTQDPHHYAEVIQQFILQFL